VSDRCRGDFFERRPFPDGHAGPFPGGENLQNRASLRTIRIAHFPRVRRGPDDRGGGRTAVDETARWVVRLAADVRDQVERLLESEPLDHHPREAL